jgi:hypothetical protein
MAMIDFPVYMATDGAGGKIEAGEWNKAWLGRRDPPDPKA